MNSTKKKRENDHSLSNIIKEGISKAKNSYCPKNRCIYLIEERITPSELGKLIGKSAADVVSFFWRGGKIINSNDFLSKELIEEYCTSLRITVKKEDNVDFNNLINKYLESKEKSNTSERPPVVGIMGHVDHGKTTLLDTIRGTKIQELEKGGITQKISACQIEFQEKKINFLDTPGHEDFIRMRHRGARLTDLIVLVIDARDGIMPQTKEIINHIKEYDITPIVFINHKKKIDTDNEKNLNKIKTQLQEQGLTPLEWEGNTIIISGNAKNRKDVEYLLENILLTSNFKSEVDCKSYGFVIDSYLNKSNQLVSDLIIRGGELKLKDALFINGKFGEAKIINSLGSKKAESSATSGQIVQIIGLNFPTELGDIFLVVDKGDSSKKIKEELEEYFQKNKKEDSLINVASKGEKKVKNIMLLTEGENSMNALLELIKKKENEKISFNVVKKMIGNLNDSSIVIAQITDSLILSFGSKFKGELLKNLKEYRIEFFDSEVIYEIEDKIDKLIKDDLIVEKFEEVVGRAEIIKKINFSKGNIAGCKIIEGVFSKSTNCHVMRKNEKLFTGKIDSLQIDRTIVKEVKAGQECGIVFRNFGKFLAGDKVVAFKIVERNVS